MPMMDGGQPERSRFSAKSMRSWLADIRDDHVEELHGPLTEYTRYRTALWLQDLRNLRREMIAFVVEDPGFNMLIDLYVNSYHGRKVSFGDACVAAHVPQTTALRALYGMIDLGYIVRMDDANDNRRKLIALTPTGNDVLGRYLDRVIGNSSD